MNQYSSAGADVTIELCSGHLLFIDPLYLETITESKALLPVFNPSAAKEYVQELERVYFTYGGDSLLGYQFVPTELHQYTLSIQDIRTYSLDETEAAAVSKDNCVFCIDSGTLLLLDLINLPKLVDLLDLEELSDLSPTAVPEFVRQLNQNLGNRGWGIVECPGVGSGYDFEGSGSYSIQAPVIHGPVSKD
jgi:hypothetical protein